MTYSNELYHHGIKGQKGGVRRFQNRDGSYTSLGERRRRVGSTAGNVYSTARKNAKLELKIAKNKYKQAKAEEKAAKRDKKEVVGSTEDQAARRKKIIKAAVAVGATAAVAGLAIYGSKKLRDAAVSDLVKKDIDNAINNAINRGEVSEADLVRAYETAKRAANRDYKDYEVRSAAKRVVKRQADSVRERARSATAPVRDRVNDISREADQRLRDRRAEQIAYLQRAAGNKSETASDVARRLANKPTSEMFSRSDRLAEAGRVAGERARASVRRTARSARDKVSDKARRARDNFDDLYREADRNLRGRNMDQRVFTEWMSKGKVDAAAARAWERSNNRRISTADELREMGRIAYERRRKKGR